MVRDMLQKRRRYQDESKEQVDRQLQEKLCRDPTSASGCAIYTFLFIYDPEGLLTL
jgi:hypothetical protein